MKEIISVAVVGALVAIGKLLIGKERLSLRLLVGRAIMGAGLGLIAYPAVFYIAALIPGIAAGLELQIIIGVACALSAAGTEIFEQALKAVVEKFTGKKIN